MGEDFNQIAKFKCPKCGFEEDIEIPTNKCLIFYTCKNCKTLIKTPEGSCCIICSYTNKKCFAR